MNDAAVVRRRERIDDLQCQMANLLQRQCSVVRYSFVKRLAVDELHDDAGRRRGLFESVDLRDVRVIDGREQLRLAFETRHPFAVACQLFRQYFDGNVPLQPGIAPAIHLPHAALADQGANLVRAEASAGRQRHDSGRAAEIIGRSPHRSHEPRAQSRNFFSGQ